MYPKITFAVLSIFVTFSSAALASSVKVEPRNYLDYGKQYREKEFRWVAKRVEAGDWGGDAYKLARDLFFVERITLECSMHGIDPKLQDEYKISTYDEERIYFLNGVVQDLESFSRNIAGLAKCHNGHAKTFVGLVNYAFGGLRKFQKALEQGTAPKKSILFEYLTKYGRKHLEECLGETLENFEEGVRRLAKGNAERRMDSLVSMGEEYPHEEADVRLLARAEELDLAQGKYDGQRMLFNVRHLMSPEDHKRYESREAGKQLWWFIDETCRELRRAFPQVDLYNLAALMIPEKVSALKVPLKFRKLNEYSRICIPFDSVANEEKPRANVMRNTKG